MAMEMRRRLVAGSHGCAAVLSLTLLAAATSNIQAQGFIAGTTPDRRPENAPRIEKFEKPSGWFEAAVAGVTQPYPASLKFLDDQGAWFTPFIHPGMLGPYDLRGLHSQPAHPQTH